MAPRWCVERGDEGIPALGIQCEYAPICQSFFRFSERGIEYKFADRFARRRRRGLQSLFRNSVKRRSSFSVLLAR